jgi:hypothetical protein
MVGLVIDVYVVYAFALAVKVHYIHHLLTPTEFLAYIILFNNV